MMLLVLLSGCVRIIVGNGNTTVEDRDVGAFDSLDAAGAVAVSVVGGDTPGVRVTCDENLQPYLHVEVRGDTLVIEERGDKGAWVELRPEGDCHIEVTATTLRSVELSGSSTVTVDDGETVALSGLDRGEISGSGTLAVHAAQAVDELRLDISGSGALLLDGVTATSTRVEISGSGSVTATGTTQSSRVDISGSGNLRLRDLVAADVDAEISGSGHAEVTATASFRAEISGSGSIEVWGDPPEHDEEISGTGGVEYR